MINKAYLGFFLYFSGFSLRMIYPVPFLAIACLVIMSVLLISSFSVIRGNVIVCLALMLAIFISSNFYTPAPGYGFLKTSWFCGYILMAFFIASLDSYSLSYIKSAIEDVATLLSPIFMFFFIKYILSDFNIFSRFNVNEANPIIVAQLFSIFFISLISTDKSSSFKLLLSLFYLLMVIMAGSKGPLLGLLIGGGVVCYKIFKSYRGYILLSVVSIVFVYLILSSYISDSVYLDYITNRFVGDSSSNSVSSRLDLFALAISGFIDFTFFEVLFGKGAGSFGYLYAGIDEVMYPHNLFLEALYEFGIVFTALFFGLLIFLIVKFYYLLSNHPKDKLVWFYVLFGFVALVSSMTTGDFSTNWSLYFFLGIALNEVNFVKRKC